MAKRKKKAERITPIVHSLDSYSLEIHRSANHFSVQLLSAWKPKLYLSVRIFERRSDMMDPRKIATVKQMAKIIGEDLIPSTLAYCLEIDLDYLEEHIPKVEEWMVSKEYPREFPCEFVDADAEPEQEEGTQP